MDYLLEYLPQVFPWWIGSGMWIYGFHQPIATFIKGCFHSLLGESITAKWTMLLLAWAIVLVISIIVAFITKRLIPRLYTFVTGGRI